MTSVVWSSMVRRITKSLRSKRVGVLGRRPAADHELADRRHRLAGDPAALGLVGIDLAPAERDLALGLDPLLDQRADLRAALDVGREEAHRDRQGAGLGDVLGFDAELGSALADEGVGELDQDAGAVACIGVGPRRAAVLEQVEGRDGALDHLVDRLAVEARKARDATPIVLVGRVVETSGPGRDGSGRAVGGRRSTRKF